MRKPLLMTSNDGYETRTTLSVMSKNSYAHGMSSTTSRKYRRWMEKQRRKGNACEFELSAVEVAK